MLVLTGVYCILFISLKELHIMFIKLLALAGFVSYLLALDSGLDTALVSVDAQTAYYAQLDATYTNPTK